MVIASCRYYPIDNKKEGTEIELDQQKITVRQDQLKEIYQKATQIQRLEEYSDTTFALGRAIALAKHIQFIVQTATHGKLRKK